MKRELILYGKNNCQLCDEMLVEVEGLIKHRSCICTVVKIDTDPVLKQKYGARVPVLEYRNTVISEGRLDVQMLMKYLQNDPAIKGN